MGTILKSLITGGAFRYLMAIPTVGHGVAYLLEELETGLVRFERELSQYVHHEDQTLTGKFDPKPEPDSGATAPNLPSRRERTGPQTAPAVFIPEFTAPDLPPSVAGPQTAPGGAPESAPAPPSDLPPLGG